MRIAAAKLTFLSVHWKHGEMTQQSFSRARKSNDGFVSFAACFDRSHSSYRREHRSLPPADVVTTSSTSYISPMTKRLTRHHVIERMEASHPGLIVMVLDSFHESLRIGEKKKFSFG